MRIAVVGAGYVGGVSAAGFAASGHEVALHDLRPERAQALVSGRPPFHEPGLSELVGRTTGRLRAVHDLSAALRAAEVALVCVDTPAREDGRIDLARVDSAVKAIASAAASDELVVVIRSTVIPGTATRLEHLLRAEGPRPLEVASNPEFLREGRAVGDFTDPDRIVIGVRTERARARAAALYSPEHHERIQTMTTESAELAKYANNSLLALLISFSNELAALAETLPKVDVLDALRAVHADRRWREKEGGWDPAILSYLWPGFGYGGSCLPKDVKAIVAEARSTGGDLPILATADLVNEAQPSRLAERIMGRVRLDGATVAVLGIAFKAGTDDVRSSPALRLAREIAARGARVVTYDPLVAGVPGFDAASDLEAALGAASIWIVTTWAPEFADLPARAASSGTVFVDGRRQYPPEGAGYIGPGRSS